MEQFPTSAYFSDIDFSGVVFTVIFGLFPTPEYQFGVLADSERGGDEFAGIQGAVVVVAGVLLAVPPTARLAVRFRVVACGGVDTVPESRGCPSIAAIFHVVNELQANVTV